VTACSLLPSILWYVLCCDDLTFPVRHAQQIEAGIPSRTGLLTFPWAVLYIIKQF
jgi:hypothetical protein